MNRSTPFGVALAVSAAVLVETTPARGEDRGADAERLFREAQQLLEARDYANACPKLERAYQLDKKLGTLINLAFCHKAQESYWLAWVELRQAEVMAVSLGRTDRRDFVRQQLAEVEKKGKLAVVIVDNPRSEPLTEVLVEDRKIPEAETGAPFMVEPTTTVDRKFTFRAKGKKSVEKLVKIARSEKSVQHVAVPAMEVQTELPPPPVVTKGAEEDPRPSPTRDVAPDDGGLQRIIGWSLVGLGVAGVGVGSYFGVDAIGNPCADTDKPPCTPEAKSKGDRDALISTLAIGGGVGAIGGGLFLVLTAGPKAAPATGTRARVEPVVGATFAGIRGRF